MTDYDFSLSLAKDIFALLKNKSILKKIGAKAATRYVLKDVADRLMQRCEAMHQTKVSFDIAVHFYGVLVKKEDFAAFSSFKKKYSVDTSTCKRTKDKDGNIVLNFLSEGKKYGFVFDPRNKETFLRLA